MELLLALLLFMFLVLVLTVLSLGKYIFTNRFLSGTLVGALSMWLYKKFGGQ